MPHSFIQNLQLIREHTVFGIGSLIFVLAVSLVFGSTHPIIGKALWPEMKRSTKIIGFTVLAASGFVLATFMGGSQIRHQLEWSNEIKGIRAEVLAMRMDEAARSFYLAKLDERDWFLNTPPTPEVARKWLVEAKERFPQQQIAQKQP